VDNGVEIRDVSDSPDSFSPNNDGFYDTTSISYTLSKTAFVSIVVRGPSGAVVRTLLNGVSRQAGGNATTWDGKDDQGGVVPDGLYSYTIQANDGAQAAVPSSSDILVR
jgi:flagellar hook assembly protein FlgD